MYHVTLRFAWLVFFLLCAAAHASEPTPFTLSTMPRVDVHAHIPPKWEVIDEYMQLRDALKKEFGVEMESEAALSVQTVGEAVDFVAKYVNQ